MTKNFNNGLFETYTRRNNDTPTLKCNQLEDRLTKSSGKLTYPVGLITIDEGMFAGVGSFESPNTTNYLYSGSYFWTMSPEYDMGSFIYNYTIGSYIYSDSSSDVFASHGVRPVISIKGDLKFTGDGSYKTPFEINVSE